MKFGQLMEYNVKNTFLQKSCRIVVDPILFFKKALRKVKASCQHLSFNIF